VTRIEKLTANTDTLSAALGVTVERPDAFARVYIVRKGERVLHATARTLRAMICEAGGDPLGED